MESIPYEILILILQDIIYINYCFVNKIIYKNKNKIIRDICITHGAPKKVPKYKDPWIWLLLEYYPHQLNNDICKYRLYILQFLCNYKRKSTIISCKSKYHAKLVQNFCNIYNLKCNIYNEGYKKILKCPICRSRNFRVKSLNYNYTFCNCEYCQYYVEDYINKKQFIEIINCYKYVNISKIEIVKP